jgi:hypothetical protein
LAQRNAQDPKDRSIEMHDPSPAMADGSRAS